MKALVVGCTRNLGIIMIRALASAGYEVIGIDNRPMPLGLRSRFAARYEHYRARTAEEEYREIEKLVRLHRPDAIVATRLTPLLASRARELSQYTNPLLPDAESYARLTDKLQLYKLCREFGIPAARPLSEQEAEQYLAGDPSKAAQRVVVVKPQFDLGGGRGVTMIREAGQVGPALEDIRRAIGPAFVSEFVPGPLPDILAINLLFDQNSRLVDYFAYRKLRLWPPESGVTALGRSVFARELTERIMPIFKELAWRGAADAEFKTDELTGETKLLEINGRFSGAIAFGIGCGINFPVLLCEAVTGKGRESDLTPRYREGVLYWNPRLFIKSVWRDWRNSGYRWSAVSEALSQVAGERVGNPWRLDDPAPLIGKMLIHCQDALRRKTSDD